MRFRGRSGHRVTVAIAPALLSLLLGMSSVAQEGIWQTRRVEYFLDSVQDIEGDRLTLLGGTQWILALEPLLLLPITEVLVLFEHDDLRFATIYADGEAYVGTRLRGVAATALGTKTYVVKSLAEGAVLQTADGSLWSVPEYDRFDTGFWLPPYPVLITGNELYMYNLDRGKRVWVKRER